MRIYLAGSFNHAATVRPLAERIRKHGHNVYCFCDEDETANKLSIAIRSLEMEKMFNPKTAVAHPMVQAICQRNWDMLLQTDVLVVALPCGKSAHFEAGYIAGKGKNVFVYGAERQYAWDAMYCMMDGVFYKGEFDEMMEEINKLR